jgi:hypothetical protein
MDSPADATTRHRRLIGSAGVWSPYRAPKTLDTRRPIARTMTAALAIALMASACGGKDASPPTAAGPGTVQVTPGHSASLHLDDLVVTIPAHAVSRPGTLSARRITAPAAAPPGMVLAGPAYDLQLNGTTLKRPVRLAVAVRAPTAGMSAGPAGGVLVFYDTAAGRWRPVNASYNPATRMLTAVSPHLSTWSVLRLNAPAALAAIKSDLAGFFGIPDFAQPSCPGSSQLADLGVTVTADPGDLVKWCAGDTGTGTVVRVASNRDYALEADYPSTWPVRRLGSPDPISQQILTSLPALSLRAGGPRTHTTIIPGGYEIQVAPPAGESGKILIVPSAEGITYDAVLFGVDTLALTYGDIPGVPKATAQQTSQAIADLFQSRDCITQMRAVASNALTQANAGVMFRSLVDIAVGCLGQYWPAIAGINGSQGALAVSTALWLASATKIMYDTEQAAIDTAVYWQGYHIYVESASAATKPSPAPFPSPTLSPAALTGTWTGSYVCSQGDTGLRMVIQAAPDGTLTATFSFYAVPDNPDVPSGSFTMTGTYSATGVNLTHDQWISQPSGYEMVDLSSGPPVQDGTVLAGSVTTPGCSTFTVTRGSAG